MDKQELIDKLNTARQADLAACAKVIDAALEEYGCAISGTPSITPDGRIVVTVAVVLR